MTSLCSGPLTAHAVRLDPGADLVSALQTSARQAMTSTNTLSAFVLTAVGSLSQVTLRMANATSGDHEDLNTWNERLEIVSLVGTFSADSSKHLHMTVADAKGRAFGGHLVQGTVFTTLELVLGTIGCVKFERTLDDRTGYRELVVSQTENVQVEE